MMLSNMQQVQLKLVQKSNSKTAEATDDKIANKLQKFQNFATK